MCVKSAGQNRREFIITLSFMINLHRVCHIYYADMCKVCLRGGRHKSGFNDLLVTAVLHGGKGDFPMAITLSLYTANTLPLKSCISVEVHCHKLFQDLNCFKFLSPHSARFRHVITDFRVLEITAFMCSPVAFYQSNG